MDEVHPPKHFHTLVLPPTTSFFTHHLTPLLSVIITAIHILTTIPYCLANDTEMLFIRSSDICLICLMPLSSIPAHCRCSNPEAMACKFAADIAQCAFLTGFSYVRYVPLAKNKGPSPPCLTARYARMAKRGQSIFSSLRLTNTCALLVN